MIIKTDESLTWFHLDDLDGCQLSILFVSCLVFTKITNITVAAVSTTHTFTAAQFHLTYRPAGASLQIRLKIQRPLRRVIPKNFHFSSLFLALCTDTRHFF